MAVGDIVSFSTVSEYTDGSVLLESIDRALLGAPQAADRLSEGH